MEAAADSNRTGIAGGLNLPPLSSRWSACGARRPNRTAASSFVSVPPLLLLTRSLRPLRSLRRQLFIAFAATKPAALAAISRPSAMQSGMPMARNPLPVTNMPGIEASCSSIVATRCRWPTSY